jgi:hypothetical protein
MGIPESCVDRRSSCVEKGRSFSVVPSSSDEIWRVKVDHCWFDDTQKKVDYLFWIKASSGNKAIILVELKGSDYGKALQQIENTLRLLCKYSHRNIIHTGSHKDSPGHNLINHKGIQAYVVLSQGHEASSRRTRRGRKIPQRSSQLERIRQKYHVRVQTTTKRFRQNDVEKFFK